MNTKIFLSIDLIDECKSNRELSALMRCSIFSIFQLSLDGSWDTMPEGFPQLEAMDRSVEVTLRFPAFSQRAVFGLTVQPMKLGQTENEVNKALAAVNKDKRETNNDSNSGEILRSLHKSLLLILSLFLFL